MKRTGSAFLVGVFLSGFTLPVYAEGLLGILGAPGDNALVTLGAGNASQSGVVNVGLGGAGNIADVNVGGSSPLATASVGSTTDSALDAQLGLGNVAKGKVTLANTNSLLDADINLLDGAGTVGATLGGPTLAAVAIGIGGGGGGGGGNGGVGPGNGPGAPGNPVGVAGVTGNSGANNACVGASANQVQALLQSTRIDASWQRASNVAIKPVTICPDVRAWLAAALRDSGIGGVLSNAVRSDALLSASLSRSSFGPDRVFAVQRTGAQLTVYVY